MEARGDKKPGGALRLLLFAGLAANMVGCAIHHYHHFDEKAALPSAHVAPVLAHLGSPQSIEDREAVKSPFQAPVAQASYKQMEPESIGGAKEPANKASGSSEALTFDQAVSATLMGDPKIRAGLEAITQANADLLTSSLFPNPTLLMDGIFLPLRRFTPENPGGPPQMDVAVTYPIDWFLFGKRAAAMVSATVGVRQSEAGYADLIRLRVTSSALAFYDVLEAKALLVLASQDVDNLSKLEAATKKAADAGGRPIVELNRVRLDLLKSRQALREAETAVVVTKAKLRALLNRTDPDPTFDVAGNLDAPLTAEPLPVEEAYVLAQENRPDIKSLRFQVTKAEADMDVEKRKAFPQVTPQVGYTRQFQQEVLGVPDADSMTVAVTTTLPFFDRNQGNRRKAASVAAQNNLNLRTGLVDLRAEVQQAVQELRTASQKAQAVAQEQLKLAEDVLASITKAYEVGGRPLIDVLDAQRNYRDTYRLYINSRADYWRAVYKYSSAIGKQVQP